MTKSLSSPALKVISTYQNLPFSNFKILCPYFNNKRSKVRAGLRVLVGKGEPMEIVEEATLIALRERIDLKELDKENLTKFLVDHNLGIDCSGLAYHIMNAESIHNGQGQLKKRLAFPYIKNPLRKLLAKLRSVENTGVHTLAHDKNSEQIKLNSIKPGDLVTILNAGTKKNLSHVLIIHQVDYDQAKQPKTIYYTHSFQLPTDGQYNHGIKQGKVIITRPDKGILDQEWTETEIQNYTKTGNVDIRRIR